LVDRHFFALFVDDMHEYFRAAPTSFGPPYQIPTRSSGPRICLDQHMNMVRPDMGGKQSPMAL
jgi:hypothetical protein